MLRRADVGVGDMNVAGSNIGVDARSVPRSAPAPSEVTDAFSTIPSPQFARAIRLVGSGVAFSIVTGCIESLACRASQQ